MDIKAVMEHLPHRYPFLMIDRILAIEPGKTVHALKNVSINEPMFQGHFPGNPVFPGVLIVEALAQAAGVLAFTSTGDKPNEKTVYYLAGVDKTRFKKPVVPGDQLHLHVTVDKVKAGIGRFKAVAQVDGQTVCETELLCAVRTIE
ncbi:3-hydroxyacyl-ACP dehydratase FabZ [Oryzomicrobium sp.]|uniref:3-hydroxyacyl-ACP dehydratase FabZ n=1 Tax=Oryzomicrobium sp. TaxID=1911578 RepID=UPI0025DD8021|nr:3-hydroxyacyl-ACP dehydratase FabZ [Oryzomicrobium sp.]MCE1242792.1 3-hydroxyacyl-ACP dehydratase FabZ [Oryzomicrobium sp.]